MNILKKIAKVIIAFLIGVTFAFIVFYSVFISAIELPTIEEIQSFDNVSMNLPAQEQNTLKKSRKSTVRIFSESDERISTLTGTYFTAKNRYFVLTAMHGIIGECEQTKIWAPSGFTDCLQFVELNESIDYAIIELKKEIPSKEPVKLPHLVPKGKAWEQALATQNKVFYTGFPNSTGPLTFSGNIIGYMEGDYIYLQSFGWGGSSGAGVFTSDGKFIGYLLALDVGETEEYGVDVLEDIVIVVPAFKIDWTTILN
jgi:hypothetical protein